MISEELIAHSEKSYAAFQAALTPGVPLSAFIGVRVPALREIGKKYFGTEEGERFMSALPHKYYEENMLHGIMISQIKQFDTCLAEVDRFLPYVDNWAVCDTLSPAVFKRNREKLFPIVKNWMASERVYTCRFGVKCLMNYYLDDLFRKEYLELPLVVKSDEYYVKMMVAWYYATALAKQYDEAVKLLESRVLPVWVHNKTIRKAIESYRVTDERKEYLRTLIIK